MIDEGLFDRYPCDAVFAMHNMPGIAQGRLEMRAGAAMASGDRCSIALRGVGGTARCRTMRAIRSSPRPAW